MKKFVWTACLGFGLLLAACGTASTTTAPETTAPAQMSSGGQPADAAATEAAGEAPATMEIKLLVGTLKLEGTDLAVTQDQAAALLPLWQQIRTLTWGAMRGPGGPGGPDQTPAASTPAADDAETQQQIDALLGQIQAAMTGEQLQAIEEMQITQASAASAIQELLGTQGGPPGAGPNQPEGFGNDQQPPASGNGTQAASGGGFPGGRNGGTDQMLLAALIRTLQTRAGVTAEPNGNGGGPGQPPAFGDETATPA